MTLDDLDDDAPANLPFDEFIAKLRRHVDQFEETWQRNMENDPGMWPAEMWEGDWFEQFTAFSEGAED